MGVEPSGFTPHIEKIKKFPQKSEKFTKIKKWVPSNDTQQGEAYNEMLVPSITLNNLLTKFGNFQVLPNCNLVLPKHSKRSLKALT